MPNRPAEHMSFFGMYSWSSSIGYLAEEQILMAFLEPFRRFILESINFILESNFWIFSRAVFTEWPIRPNTSSKSLKIENLSHMIKKNTQLNFFQTRANFAWAVIEKIDFYLFLRSAKIILKEF
ncbi:hypothetical protein BpHYR1_016970 [Brachionus plicatilis]|uniref:Uncharacterized protein n=1 Tax=Brachionus plicatilis TaxID=10195 RepID=A0A3M7S9A0_BRAPC|nr:hypothetical protein BpHYR1_016970 [Brachionus plicatilis]